MKDPRSIKRVNTLTQEVMYGKVPPQAPDFEESVLGALMIDKDAIDAMFPLTAADFYDDRHHNVFEAIMNLHRLNQPVDLMTVTEQLRSMGKLEEAGGPFYVTTLTNRVASTAHIEHHSRIIKQKSLQRALITISSNAANAAYDDTIDVFELFETVETQLTEANSVTIGSEIKNMAEISKDYDKNREEQKLKKKRTGVPSPLKDVRGKIGQYNNGDLIIVAARASMGKTAFAVEEILGMAKMGIPVGFISMEMRSPKIYLRLVACESGLTMRKIEEMNDITSLEYEAIVKARATINNLPIYMDDLPNPTLLQFRARCLRMKRKFNVEILFADHLGKITIPELIRDLYTMTTNIARNVKSIAALLDIPLIMLTQLSRKTESRKDMRPMLSDLKDTGAIEEEADMVGLLYRPEYYKNQGISNFDTVKYHDQKISTEGYAEVNWAKNRNGPTGLVALSYVSHCMRFEDYQPSFVREHKNKTAAEDFAAADDDNFKDGDLFRDQDKEPPF